MKLVLRRRSYRLDGVFGELTDELGNHICFTLERSYADLYAREGLSPKVPPGTYKCVKGMHRLPNMTQKFETFEVKGVPGRWGILFHVGNYNEDSDGCILLGEGLGTRFKNGVMLTNSKKAFAKFMALLKDVEEFVLLVTL
jgi:hypothetical protein